MCDQTLSAPQSIIDRSDNVKEQQMPREYTYAVTDREKKKAVWSSPVLTAYGSVGRLTSGSATVGNDGTNTRKNTQSDRLTKENITRIGEHPFGVGLYLFDFKPEFRDRCGHGRQFGVMADEVERVLPEAVSVHQNGYKTVDYLMLGIRTTLH